MVGAIINQPTSGGVFISAAAAVWDLICTTCNEAIEKPETVPMFCSGRCHGFILKKIRRERVRNGKEIIHNIVLIASVVDWLIRSSCVKQRKAVA